MDALGAGAHLGQGMHLAEDALGVGGGGVGGGLRGVRGLGGGGLGLGHHAVLKAQDRVVDGAVGAVAQQPPGVDEVPDRAPS